MGEVLVILVVALLVFGGRLPEIGKSLGRGIVEFKEGLKGKPAGSDDDDDDGEEEKEEEEELPYTIAQADPEVSEDEEPTAKSDNGSSPEFSRDAQP